MTNVRLAQTYISKTSKWTAKFLEVKRFLLERFVQFAVYLLSNSGVYCFKNVGGIVRIKDFKSFIEK